MDKTILSKKRLLILHGKLRDVVIFIKDESYSAGNNIAKIHMLLF